MQSATAVDLALVLAVDCSSSVDEGDYHLQMDGIAAALRNPPLFEAIGEGRFRKIAVTLLQWSNHRSQQVAVPWRVLASPLDIEAFARQAETAKRQWLPGGTALAAGITYSLALLETLPITASRRVIDVSGDGEDNDGGDVDTARDGALARGVTINGLPILYGSDALETYYRNHVIGGPDAFLMAAANLQSFKDAITRKLLREVRPLTV